MLGFGMAYALFALMVIVHAGRALGIPQLRFPS